jgi:lipoprotein-anchoring transpeptidase ErfK/SrfK
MCISVSDLRVSRAVSRALCAAAGILLLPLAHAVAQPSDDPAVPRPPAAVPSGRAELPPDLPRVWGRSIIQNALEAADHAPTGAIGNRAVVVGPAGPPPVLGVPPATVAAREAMVPAGPEGEPTAALREPSPEEPEAGSAEALPPQFHRQIVDYRTSEPAGTIVIDTPNTFLYLVLEGGKAIRYGVGVGREGFTWSGSQRINRMAEWPDWRPPAEMIQRQPYLPRFMAGGPGNPMGARALYLGNTIYRIHGTNQPATIGNFVSSGCIRLVNEDIEDLYNRVTLGTRVVVLPGRPPQALAGAH